MFATQEIISFELVVNFFFIALKKLDKLFEKLLWMLSKSVSALIGDKTKTKMGFSFLIYFNLYFLFLQLLKYILAKEKIDKKRN